MRFYLITLLILFFTTIFMYRASAAEQCGEAVATASQTISTNVPRALKDATIVVYDATGKLVGQMSINEYKVVPRQREELITKRSITCRVTRKDLSPNRATLVFGEGPSGHLRSKSDGANVEVSAERDRVLGLQYQRSLDEHLSLGVQVLDNESAAALIGIDF